MFREKKYDDGVSLTLLSASKIESKKKDSNQFGLENLDSNDYNPFTEQMEEKAHLI